MRVMVTGGAGYLGSHTVLALLGAGHEVVVVDDFRNAKRSVISRLRELAGCQIDTAVCDVADRDRLAEVFARAAVDAVIHFAGDKAVAESVAHPLGYYRNNVAGALSLVDVMSGNGCRTLIFSSSATVYGHAAPVPYREDHEPLAADSPYGRTKVMIEQILRDVASADDRWRIGLLRYFNPVGAHTSGLIGEDPTGTPNNLMPYLAQVAVGRLGKLRIFGADYETPDGTCERDFIHVDDLATGHVAALGRLTVDDRPVRAWNLGTGRGTSVMAMVAAFEATIGRPLAKEYLPRRPGDLPSYWADPSRARRELGWVAQRSLEDMCADSWRWQSRNPTGYPPD